MKTLLPVFILVALLCLLIPTHAQDCIYQYEDMVWDLTPLRKQDGQGDYHIQLDLYNFYINVCGNTAPNEYCSIPNPAYYYLWFGTCIIIGSLDNVEWGLINPSDPAVGPSLTYFTRDTCNEDGPTEKDSNDTMHVKFFREIKLNFRCKEGVEGGPYQLSDPAGCTTTVDFETMYGCAGKGKAKGLSGGSILLIILLVLIVVYIIGGFVFNVKYKGMPFNKEAFPHLEFWGSIPGLVKDGVVFTVSKIRGARS